MNREIIGPPCNLLESEQEKLLQEVKDLWVLFVARTNGLSDESGIYIEGRKNLSVGIKTLFESVSTECQKAITQEPVAGDPYHRTRFDIAMDDLMANLGKNFPRQVDVQAWPLDHDYWPEFLKERAKKN